MNNFEYIKPHLVFNSNGDDFYYLQIIKRRKENPDNPSNARVVNTYYVTSVEYLESRMDEIIGICDVTNSRAYINLNRRSFKNMAYEVNEKIAHQLKNRDYYSVRRAYEKESGSVNNEPKKTRKWVIDIDTKSTVEIARIVDVIKYCTPTDRDKIICDIPTKNGVHLITYPFHKEQFDEKCDELVEMGIISERPNIQQNNPTILYMKS